MVLGVSTRWITSRDTASCLLSRSKHIGGSAVDIVKVFRGGRGELIPGRLSPPYNLRCLPRHSGIFDKLDSSKRGFVSQPEMLFALKTVNREMISARETSYVQVRLLMEVVACSCSAFYTHVTVTASLSRVNPLSFCSCLSFTCVAAALLSYASSPFPTHSCVAAPHVSGCARLAAGGTDQLQHVCRHMCAV